jgi:uncharacterized protein YndB with AHSA1/START domain
MARIVFETEAAAAPEVLVRALTTQEGITAWWTDDAEVPGELGSVMTLGFPIAPKRFELRFDVVSPETVRWSSVGAFPPHWVGTTVTWRLTPGDTGRTKIHFDHDGWTSDSGPFPTSAYTWGQLLPRLQRYAETGQGEPLFTRL